MPSRQSLQNPLVIETDIPSKLCWNFKHPNDSLHTDKHGLLIFLYLIKQNLTSNGIFAETFCSCLSSNRWKRGKRKRRERIFNQWCILAIPPAYFTWWLYRSIYRNPTFCSLKLLSLYFYFFVSAQKLINMKVGQSGRYMRSKSLEGNEQHKQQRYF